MQKKKPALSRGDVKQTTSSHTLCIPENRRRGVGSESKGGKANELDGVKERGKEEKPGVKVSIYIP